MVGEVIGTVVVLFVAAGAIGFVITLYNSLIALKNDVVRAWANIDVLLKQRHDELPKLVRTCEGYMQHERAVFDKLSEARGALLAAKNVPQRAEAEGQITQALGRLFAVAENYPDLKANEEFLSLQRELVDTEDRIQVARRIYNANVRSYDSLIQSFPALLMARRFHFTLRPYFEVEAAVREAGPPSVDLSGQT
jgi:LemA protein